MQQVQSRTLTRLGSLLGPGFLIFVILAFFVIPGSTLDKFTMVCFGI